MTSHLPLRFRFDSKKFVAGLAFFAGETSNLDKLKVAKLFYYADKYHLIRYGYPILGDVYYHLDYGPVPSQALNIMNEAIDPYKSKKVKITQANLELLKKYLKVDAEKRHPIFVLKASPDLTVLSDSEQEALQETVKQYGHYSGVELIKLTHREPTWKETRQNAEIDYRLFFKNEKEAKQEALEYLESLQEQMELSFQLTSPS